MKCCLCGNEIEVNLLSGWSDGNNAMPLAEGRCCDMCDVLVIQERIKRSLEERK